MVQYVHVPQAAKWLHEDSDARVSSVSRHVPGRSSNHLHRHERALKFCSHYRTSNLRNKDDRYPHTLESPEQLCCHPRVPRHAHPFQVEQGDVVHRAEAAHALRDRAMGRRWFATVKCREEMECKTSAKGRESRNVGD